MAIEITTVKTIRIDLSANKTVQLDIENSGKAEIVVVSPKGDVFYGVTNFGKIAFENALEADLSRNVEPGYNENLPLGKLIAEIDGDSYTGSKFKVTFKWPKTNPVEPMRY